MNKGLVTRNAALRNALFVLLLVVFGLVAGLGGYFAGGRSDAIEDTRPLTRLADRLIDHGEGGEGLGPGRQAMLLAVEDPAFADHAGIDMETPGAGLTTLTQSLAKRLGFDRFEPGIAKIRQSGYASGLETRLSKSQILALWLETVEMGEGPRGWITGFYEASKSIYHRPPARLTDNEFLRLVAVVIAPGRFHLEGRDPALDARVGRIRRLVAGQCRPRGNGDVWLDGCAAD
jgi:hypothetical protein